MNIDLSKLGTVPPVVPPVVEQPKATIVEDLPKTKLKSYFVKLDGEPEVLIENVEDRLHAQEVYNKTLGIIKTERKYTYREA